MISKNSVTVWNESTGSPTTAIGLFTSLLILLGIATTLSAFSGYAILLNENQILYLFSTSAQVIAGIYGLTLTGFIFLRNELSREEFEDDTLTQAVQSLKARYFALLVFITVLVSLTLLLANLAISLEDSSEPWLTTLIINAGQSAFLTSLSSVAYFIFDVLSPSRIEMASKTLQRKFDPSLAEQTKGSLEEFLRNYNQIEMLLQNAGQPYKEVNTGTYDKRNSRRMSNSRLAEILLRNEQIDKLLFRSLLELITLRNSIIHGADPVVSQGIVETSSEVLQKLQETLVGGQVSEN